MHCYCRVAWESWYIIWCIINHCHCQWKSIIFGLLIINLHIQCMRPNFIIVCWCQSYEASCIRKSQRWGDRICNIQACTKCTYSIWVYKIGHWHCFCFKNMHSYCRIGAIGWWIYRRSVQDCNSHTICLCLIWIWQCQTYGLST